jgi:hypothetical protein
MKIYKATAIVLILGLMLSIYTDYQRYNIEQSNDTVEIILDYNEIKSLANQSEHSFSWWLKEMKSFGVTSVALNEETPASLVEDRKGIQGNLFYSIKEDIRWDERYDRAFVEYALENVDPYNLVLEMKDESLYESIRKGVESRYDESFYHMSRYGDLYIIVLNSGENNLLFGEEEEIKNFNDKTILRDREVFGTDADRIGLGLDTEKIQIIQDSGLKVLPRYNNYQTNSDKLVDADFEEMKEYGLDPSVLIFLGKEILGYPDNSEKLLRAMESNSISVGLIETAVQREHIEQQGLVELAEDLKYDAVRVFSVWPYIQQRYRYYNYEGAEEIENTLYRAVTERNIRIIYFKPFMFNDYQYVTEPEAYESMFNGLEERLKDHDIAFGAFSVMPAYNIGATRRMALGAGVIAGAVLLAGFMLQMKERYLAGLFIAGQGVNLLLGIFVSSFYDKIMALGAAVVFSSLAILYTVSECARIYKKQRDEKEFALKESLFSGARILVLASIIALSGGIFIGAILSSSVYFLELDIFRGVKVSQLLPILIFAMIYISYFGYKSERINKNSFMLFVDNIGRLMEDKIKIKHLIAFSVLGAIGFVYIARTGHETSIEPTDVEMIARNFLEYELIARPRTKEFLIAFPSLMVAVYFATIGRRRWIFPFLLLGTIGFTSIVNTFSHMRTPIYLSIVRTVISVGFGLAIGFVVVWAVHLAISFYRRVERRLADE